MIATKHHITLLAAMLFATTFAFAQRGPGGVSTEVNDWVPTDTTISGFVPTNQSTSRIWLDASTLTSLADGDPVLNWPDISLSHINDNAQAVTTEIPPYFRDDAANSINGFSVVTFEEGRFLQFVSSLDINLDAITKTKTVFLAFRTGTNVSDMQILYEEGGCARGFNIYLENNLIHVGAYDFNLQGINNTGTGGYHNNGRDFDNTPQWGYTFVSTAIQANSTYVLTAQFSAPTMGVIHNDADPNPDFFVRGWLNGQVFDVINYTAGNQTNTLGANTGVNGIGTLWAHPDPIGLGAINTAFVHKGGRICNGNGTRPFQGRLAEFCYYNDLLTQTQRIIVQNYLGAKYFANIIADDKYAHEATYGVEVIGIGQHTISVDNRHLKSQGRNPFEISVQPTQLTAANQYFFAGHNNAPKNWSSVAVPNNSTNIRRLQRVWRVDETGTNMGAITFKVNTNDLPTLPAGFAKMVLLIDETNANFPNFTLESTKVLELTTADGINYSINYDFKDNSFFTLAMLKPEVSFTLSQAFAVELNPVFPAVISSTNRNVQVRLNYQPAPGSPAQKVDYIFSPVTATLGSTLGSDFNFNPTLQSAGINIPSGSRTANTPSFSIINDLIAETPATERFLIVLQNGPNTTPGLFIGQRDTLEFSIYDNDSPPIAAFELSESFVLENQAAILVKVLRVGDLGDTSVVRLKRLSDPNQGTADYSTDYILQNAAGWDGLPENRYIDLTFLPGVQQLTATVNIVNDIIYELDETIGFTLEPLVNIGVDTLSLFHQVVIVNEDPLPNASFVTSNQTGFESVGSPIIFIQLDRPSALDVEVFYSVSQGIPPALLGVDFNTANPGVVQFAPLQTEAYPNIIVYSDLEEENDEVAIFQLDSALNANVSTPNIHNYTIVDYAPFENRGAAGIGRDSDNIIWVDADRINSLHNQTLQSLPNLSPRNIDLAQPVSTLQAALQITSNTINQRKTIRFNDDYYVVSKHPAVSQSGSFNKKSFYFVIRTGTTVNGYQVLYHQGLPNGNRGMSIYIYNGKVYYNVWNRTVDSPTPPTPPLNPIPWGGLDNITNRYAESTVIIPNSNYIISCHFDRFGSEKVVVFINGIKGTSVTDQVGAFFGDDNNSYLGKLVGNTRFHTSSNPNPNFTTGYPFNGYLAEFILYNEPAINETRRCIVENYLSGKYNIPLDNIDTKQVFGLLNANAITSPSLYFGHQIAGAGIGVNVTDDLHLDSQGPGLLRVKLTDDEQLNSIVMWGHNNVPLNAAYPYSSAYLPNGIVERSGRVWKVFKTGTIGQMDLYMNFSGIQDAPLFVSDSLKLLHHTNANPQDFANATVVDAYSINSGPVVLFKDLNLPPGSYIALASTSTILPLPIELLSFTAKLLGDIVAVSWSTATEINNDYFEVQRCGPDLQWEKIAVVPGAGNSNGTLHYTHYDREPLQGISYYRLKQVDFDGQFTYSDVVAVVNINAELSDDLFIYPNPSRGGSVFVRVPAAFRTESASIKIYSAIGQVVYSGKYDTNTDLVEVKYGKLKSGVYYIAVESALINTGTKLVIY